MVSLRHRHEWNLTLSLTAEYIVVQIILVPMVCSLGSGRMAAMAKLLTAGRFSQTIAGEIGNQKLAAQFIQRELREADEANLLDEEDMHVFDLKPMTDPLHLVCCNACKKPIKASQYAAHAEFCISLSSAEEIVSELDGGTGHKKPPRKERKKLLTAYPRGEQERIESGAADDVATSDFHLGEGEQVQQTYSFSMEAKRNSSCVDGVMDVSRASLGKTDYSTGAMPPPTKRSKLLAAEGLLKSDELVTTSRVAKSLCTSQEAPTCREFPKVLSAGSEKTSDCVVGYQKPCQAHECGLLSKDVPSPLATKIYYSQRNHRLRSALAYLYHGASPMEHSGDFVNSKALQENAMPLQVSSPSNFCHEQINVQREKRKKNYLPPMQKPDQIVADSLDLCSDKLGGHTPGMSFSNHVPMNNVLTPQTSPGGIMRSNYLSKPFPYAENSGTPLGTMQQPKGSVPVT